ncbi:MAG: RDD family protein [Chitinophagales bacterium]
MSTYNSTLDQMDFDSNNAPIYAGFWLRVVAYFIDGVILQVVSSLVVMPIMGVNMEALAGAGENPEEIMSLMLTTLGPVIGITTLIGWLYFSLMESSEKQATVGKMALGLKVVDMYGDKLTFLRATGRHFAKIVSGTILGIGYIMAGFTERKQGLHDMIASTLVVKK